MKSCYIVLQNIVYCFVLFPHFQVGRLEAIGNFPSQKNFYSISTLKERDTLEGMDKIFLDNLDLRKYTSNLSTNSHWIHCIQIVLNEKKNKILSFL